jgi:hypothetical protein
VPFTDRSGLEQKMMIYLDNNKKIINWGAEHLKIPYTKTEIVRQKAKIIKHLNIPIIQTSIMS